MLILACRTCLHSSESFKVCSFSGKEEQPSLLIFIPKQVSEPEIEFHLSILLSLLFTCSLHAWSFFAVDRVYKQIDSKKDVLEFKRVNFAFLLLFFFSSDKTEMKFFFWVWIFVIVLYFKVSFYSEKSIKIFSPSNRMLLWFNEISRWKKWRTKFKEYKKFWWMQWKYKRMKAFKWKFLSFLLLLDPLVDSLKKYLLAFFSWNFCLFAL